MRTSLRTVFLVTLSCCAMAGNDMPSAEGREPSPSEQPAAVELLARVAALARAQVAARRHYDQFGRFELHSLDLLARTSAEDTLVDCGPYLLDKMEPVDNWHCVGCTATGSIGTGSATVAKR